MKYFIPDQALLGNGFFSESRADAILTNIPENVNFVATGGYYAVGDGGNASYKKVAVDPGAVGKFQSADGSWWQIVDTIANVRAYGAKGDNIADDTAAIQLAVNSGNEVFLPNGTYKTTSPITTFAVGQIIKGESAQDTYLISGAHDGLRIKDSHCEVSNIHFRPSAASNTSPPAFACIRVYAALAHIHDNRGLAAFPNEGTFILLDDVNPDDMSVVAGAYIHTIDNNRAGSAGYEFKHFVFSYCTTNGQQATKFRENQIISDTPIYMYQGGGNVYYGNLFQSSTGTQGVPVGNGIDLQDGVIGEVITENYFERYVYGTIARRAANDYCVAEVINNHYDFVTNPFSSTGSVFYHYFNDYAFRDYINGWQWDYNSQDDLKLYNREGLIIANVNRSRRSIENYLSANSTIQTLSYDANGETETPTASYCNVTGNGAARTACLFGNGVVEGQHLYAFGLTWSVQILNTNVVFDASAANVTFGNAVGNIACMHLIWNTSLAKWIEVSRTVV